MSTGSSKPADPTPSPSAQTHATSLSMLAALQWSLRHNNSSLSGKNDITFIAEFFNKAELEVSPEDTVLGPKPKIFVSPVMEELDLNTALMVGKGVLPAHITEKRTGATNQVFSKSDLQTPLFCCLENRSNLLIHRG